MRDHATLRRETDLATVASFAKQQMGCKSNGKAKFDSNQCACAVHATHSFIQGKLKNSWSLKLSTIAIGS